MCLARNGADWAVRLETHTHTHTLKLVLCLHSGKQVFKKEINSDKAS